MRSIQHGLTIISIHAPHARSDALRSRCQCIGYGISIHAPHARSDRARIEELRAAQFQSTLLMRGATSVRARPSSALLFQSTLLMRGATTCIDFPSNMSRFQSTLLMRGATHARDHASCFSDISIHAPHARSDLVGCFIFSVKKIFQSTLLMRGATLVLLGQSTSYVDFNPRSSCEERRSKLNPLTMPWIISIHAPHARSDLRLDGLECYAKISIHAPHARSDYRSAGL